MQHIAGTQGAPAMTAELAEREGGFAAEIIRHIEAARNGQISTAAAALHCAELQHAAGLDRMTAPELQRLAVQLGLHCGAGQCDDSVAIELQRRAGNGHFQPGCSSALPTRRLPRRNASASIGPDGGTPMFQ